jgi:hypothetical protein
MAGTSMAQQSAGDFPLTYVQALMVNESQGGRYCTTMLHSGRETRDHPVGAA